SSVFTARNGKLASPVGKTVHFAAEVKQFKRRRRSRARSCHSWSVISRRGPCLDGSFVWRNEALLFRAETGEVLFLEEDTNEGREANHGGDSAEKDARVHRFGMGSGRRSHRLSGAGRVRGCASCS